MYYEALKQTSCWCSRMPVV